MSYIDPSELRSPGFFAGVKAAFQSISYTLSKPILLFYVLFAVLINAALLGALLWWGWGYSDTLIGWLQQQKGSGFGATLASSSVYLLTTLKWIVFILFFLFVAPNLLMILVNINPLSSVIATQMFENVFKRERGYALPHTDSFLVEIVKALITEIAKIVVFLAMMVLLLALNLIPAFGTIVAGILLPLLSIQFAGWSYVTPYYESLGYGFGEQSRAMRRQRTAIWGLGLISIIPIINVFAIFFGLVGGALLQVRYHQE